MRVVLKLEAEINVSKRLEFSQSLMAFIKELPSCSGFVNFKEQPGTHFSIEIIWTNSELLEQFQALDTYRVFIGALITLSSSHQTKTFNQIIQ